MKGTHVLCSWHGVRPRTPAWGMELCDGCVEIWAKRLGEMREAFNPFWEKVSSRPDLAKSTRVWHGGRIIRRIPLGAFEKEKGLYGGS